ncbi:MAG: SDR family oxidoreductase [Acidobacteriota bacterium]
MKAFTLDRYGSADRVRAGEVPDPELREDDILVQTHAAGVNLLDSDIRNGEFKRILPYRLPLILGHAVAGGSRIGSRVRRFNPGDEVYARPADGRIGAFSEFIAINEDDLAIKPNALSMEEAAFPRRATPRARLAWLDQVKDSLHAYQLSKRGNSLRVMAEAVRWGKRGARINPISPGIVMTPLAKDELTGPRGEGYRRMIEGSVAKRVGTPDEVGAVGALRMGPDGGFITDTDFLMDGGTTAAYWYGDVAEVRGQ